MKIHASGFRVATFVAVVGAAFAAGVIFQDRLNPQVLEASIRGTEQWASMVFVASFALGTVLFVPGSLFGFAGGALFGPLWGTILNLLGGSLGATVAFLVARHTGAEWVTTKTGGRLKRIIAGVEAEGWRFVALTRLVPIVPFNILNYALGLTRIRLSHYVLATLICMAPGAAAYSWLGHAGKGVVIPASALVDDGGQSVAFIQKEGESFERRMVELGPRDGDWVAIKSGIAPGERVVSRGAYQLRLAATQPAVPGHGHVH